MKKEISLILSLLVFLIVLQSTLATTIYGTIYDSSLTKATPVKISIDTVPGQFMISKDSDYSFEVPEGTYTLIVEQYLYREKIAEMQEKITVTNEGTYRLDLILFPILEGFEGNETDFIADSLGELPQKSFRLLYATVSLLLITILLVFFFLTKKKKKKVPITSDLNQLYQFIKKQKRTTQREIRKQFPLSEAKISLMITDLESQDKIKKIKKGRGNIIILQ